MWTSTLSTRRRFFLLDLVLVASLSASLAYGKVVPFLQQSFFFDWTPESQVLPSPITEHCQTIHVKWSRSAATGPNPSAPYFLQVYTSSDTTPFVISAGSDLSFDWQVPFAPGTQYQICMFDSKGNTGGCQSIYTVIPSTSNATCSNLPTLPPLEAEGFVINGPWSKYGWIDQCTDLSVVPKNGTPPYTLTIAPSLHPPYNITSSDKALNWTVSLSWATPFFVSVVDQTGQTWASGPLHVGGGSFSSTGCLSGHEVNKSSIKPYVAISTGAGGLAFGLLVGSLVTWLFLRRPNKTKGDAVHLLGNTSIFGDSMLRPAQLPAQDQYRPVPTSWSSGPSESLSRGGHGYHVEHSSMPDEEGRAYGGIASQSHASGYAPTLSTGPHHLTYERDLSPPPPPPPLPPNPLQPSQTSPSRPNQVYVVHHDSQSPPVTIYHQEGTQIFELPPRYPPADSQMPNLSPSTHPDDLAMTEGRTASSSEVRTETSRSNTRNTLSLHQPRRVQTIRKLPSPGTPQ